MSKPLTVIALGGGITLAAMAFVGMFFWMESPSDEDLVDDGKTAGDHAAADGGHGATEMTYEHTEVDASAFEDREGGLKIADIKVGTGEAPAQGDLVEVHYTGWLQSNGQTFDSSKGRDPLRFPFGAPGIIEGWQKGLTDMKVGGKRQLVIPPELAYGDRGSPPKIPPGATLVFDVELVGLRKAPSRPEVDFGADERVVDLGKGLKAVDLETGSGNEVGERTFVKADLSVWSDTGELFYSSVTRPQTPEMFVGGVGAERPPLEGLDQGMRGMKAGGVRFLEIPSELGFGERGQGDVIKPNTTVYALVKVQDVGEPRIIPTEMVSFDRAAMTTTESGLMYVDVVEGTGPQPNAGDVVFAEYTGWLENGTMFDSSKKRMSAFSFPLGKGRVIKAWDEALASMKVGGKRIIVAPPDIAYGDRDKGNIPPGSTLVFEIELADVKPGGRH